MSFRIEILSHGGNEAKRDHNLSGNSLIQLLGPLSIKER